MNRVRQTVDRPGAAAAELALFLPFLALLFAVAVDFCRVFHFTQALESSAEAAALVASGTVPHSGEFPSDADAARQAAVSENPQLQPPLRTGDVSVDFDSTTALVSIRYEMQTFTPFFGSAGRVVLTRSVRMRLAPKIPGA